jgi:hypothetical protein
MAHRFRGYRAVTDTRVKQAIAKLETVENLDALVSALRAHQRLGAGDADGGEAARRAMSTAVALAILAIAATAAMRDA